MKNVSSTDRVISDMLATWASRMTPREKHLYREALRALVRLAKAERMLEISADVEKVTRLAAARIARREARALLAGVGAGNASRQGQLALDRN